MNKKYIIRKNEEIKKVISKKNKTVTKFFVIYKDSNNLNYNRYCISISKKITNAVNRNHIKRQLKSILSKNNLLNSKDYVIIVLNSVLALSYQQLKEEIEKLMKEGK